MDTKIKDTFWTDPLVEDLDGSAKLALLYLFTAHINNAGWATFTERRFTFDTGLTQNDLTRACQALGKGIITHEKGYWIRNYIRHQIGTGPKLTANLQAKGAVRCFVLMPDDIVAKVLKEYPELKPLVSPTQALTKGGRREEKSGEEKSGEEEWSPEGNQPTPQTPEEWADLAVSTYVKQDDPLPNRQLVLAAITGGADPAEIVANIRLINTYIAQAPNGKANALVPAARNFFGREDWREPSNYANRWNREPRGSPSEKKEKAAAGPSAEPEWPWRTVAIQRLGITYDADAIWADLSGDTRATLRREWSQATTETQKEWRTAP